MSELKRKLLETEAQMSRILKAMEVVQQKVSTIADADFLGADDSQVCRRLFFIGFCHRNTFIYLLVVYLVIRSCLILALFLSKYCFCSSLLAFTAADLFSRSILCNRIDSCKISKLINVFRFSGNLLIINCHFCHYD